MGEEHAGKSPVGNPEMVRLFVVASFCDSTYRLFTRALFLNVVP
jgi:hypothetical protein